MASSPPPSPPSPRRGPLSLLSHLLRAADLGALLLGKGGTTGPPRGAASAARRLSAILVALSAAALLRLFVLRSLLPRIARLLVARSKLVFASARIEQPAEDELVMAVKGALSDAGPFSVSIVASRGLDVLISAPAEPAASGGNGTPPSLLQTYRSRTPAAAARRRSPALGFGDESGALEVLPEADDITGAKTPTPSVHQPLARPSALQTTRHFWTGAAADASETAGMKKVGTVALPEIRVRRTEPVTRLDMSTRIFVVDSQALGELSEKMVGDASFALTLRGRVDLRLLGGLVTIPKVMMHKEVSMRGMAGLRSLAIQSITVERGTSDHIELSSEVEVHNPADVAVDMGDTRLTLRFERQVIGTVHLPGLFLRQGRNVVRSRVIFAPDPRNPPALAAARVLLSRFATGRTSSINIRGDHPKSTKVSYIRRALRALDVTGEMEGVAEPMLRSASILLSPRHLLTALAGTAQSRIEIANPFGESMTVLAMDGTVSVEDQVIGVIAADLSENPIVVAAMSARQSDNLPIALRVNAKAVRALLDAAGGKLFVDIVSNLTVKVGEYTTQLDYDIKSVPCSLSI